MKKLQNTVVAIVIITIAVLAFQKTSNLKFIKTDHHYVTLQKDGTIRKGSKPLNLKELDWMEVTFNGIPISVPVQDGNPILCKVGDRQGPMYKYHPFSASQPKDYEHNAATIPLMELVGFLKEFNTPEQKYSEYQAVVKVPREAGGVSSPDRDIIEGKITFEEFLQERPDIAEVVKKIRQ